MAPAARVPDNDRAWRWPRRGGLAALALALGIAAALPLPASSSGVTVPAAAPLATAWTTAQGTWADVAMGRLSQPNNTFWQLFFRLAGTTSWHLVTPPAVADNGGLVADDGSAAALTAGFEPSSGLTFSPLAQTTDDGGSWSPGVLPGALLRVPDPLAVGPGDDLLALVRASGGSLLSSAGSLSRWRHVVGLRSLAATAAGRSCGLVALRAVTEVAGDPVVGGACSSPGVVGVFTEQGGSWQRSGPRLPGAAASEPTSVLRLENGTGGTVGLLAAGRGSETTLLAIWRSSTSSAWTISSALHPAGQLLATGFGQDGRLTVVTGGDHGTEHAEAVAGVGAPWVALPVLPSGTAAVAADAGGVADALVVHTKLLVDWTLSPTGDRWMRGPTVTVPIQYGSST